MGLAKLIDAGALRGNALVEGRELAAQGRVVLVARPGRARNARRLVALEPALEQMLLEPRVRPFDRDVEQIRRRIELDGDHRLQGRKRTGGAVDVGEPGGGFIRNLLEQRRREQALLLGGEQLRGAGRRCEQRERGFGAQRGERATRVRRRLDEQGCRTAINGRSQEGEGQPEYEREAEYAREHGPAAARQGRDDRPSVGVEQVGWDALGTHG